MNIIAPRCLMFGLLFLGTLSADVNVTFLPDREGRSVTCEVSYHTGAFELHTMLVEKLRTISTAAEKIASVNVSDTVSTMEHPLLYQDQDVDLQIHYAVYVTKNMTTYALSVSSSKHDDEEADYRCSVTYSAKGQAASVTKLVDLDFKGSSTTNQGFEMSSNEKNLTAAFVAASTALLIAIATIVAYYKRKLNNRGGLIGKCRQTYWKQNKKPQDIFKICTHFSGALSLFAYIMSYNMHIVELAREEADRILIHNLNERLNAHAGPNTAAKITAKSNPCPTGQEFTAASTASVTKQLADTLIPSRGVQRKLTAARITSDRMLELASKIIPDSRMQQQLAAASTFFSNPQRSFADIEQPPQTAEPLLADPLGINTRDSEPTAVYRRGLKGTRPMGPPPPTPPQQ